MVEFAGPANAGLAKASTSATTPIALMKPHLACERATFKPFPWGQKESARPDMKSERAPFFWW